MSNFRWEEDDFLPPGVFQLQAPEPENFRTYIMYHGTTLRNAESIRKNGFRQSQDGMLGRGVYLSRDLEKACRYPLDVLDENKVVIKVKVDVGRVKKIDRQRHPLQKSWHERGYDTAWVPPDCGMVPSGLEENCVWDPRRIQIIQLIKPCVWLEDTEKDIEEDAEEDAEDDYEEDTEDDTPEDDEEDLEDNDEDTEEDSAEDDDEDLEDDEEDLEDNDEDTEEDSAEDEDEDVGDIKEDAEEYTEEDSAEDEDDVEDNEEYNEEDEDYTEEDNEDYE